MTVDPAAIVAAKGATQVALYASALVVVGAGVCRTAVFPRAGVVLTAADRRAAQLASTAAVTLLAAVAARLYVQVIDSYLTPLPTPQMIRMLIFSTRTWGMGLLAQLLAGVGLIAVTRGARGDRAGARLTALGAATAAALAVPLTGHAAAHGGPLGIGLQALHVFALGAWLGTLAVLLASTTAAPVDAFAAAVAAFSPIARIAAGTVVVAGVGALLSHVGVEGLIGSRYGTVLAVKVALFVAIAALGYVNWTRRTPRLADRQGRTALLRTARLELALGVLALVTTAVLTAVGRPGD